MPEVAGSGSDFLWWSVESPMSELWRSLASRAFNRSSSVVATVVSPDCEGHWRSISLLERASLTFLKREPKYLHYSL